MDILLGFNCIFSGMSIKVLIFCVEFQELSCLARDLSQAEQLTKLQIGHVLNWTTPENEDQK